MFKQKGKTKKKREHLLILPWVTMLISALILLFVIISLGYMWYYSVVLGPMSLIVQDQLRMQEQIEKMQPAATGDEVVEVIEEEKEKDRITDDISDIQFILSNKGNMEFKNADPYRGFYNFTGKITVTGNYTYYKKGEGIISLNDGNVCIDNIKQTDISKFPKFKEDVRDVWFCFSNLELAKEVFGPAGSSGEATVEIDNYTIDMMESEVWNTAELIKVINKK